MNTQINETLTTGRDYEGFKTAYLTRVAKWSNLTLSKQIAAAETFQVYTKSINRRNPIALSNRHLLCVVIKLTTTVLFDFSNDCAGWLRRRWMKTIPEKRLSSPSNDDTLMRIPGSPVDIFGLTAMGLSYSSSLCVTVKSKDKGTI